VSNQEAQAQEICRKVKPFIWLAKFKFELSSQEQFGQKTGFVADAPVAAALAPSPMAVVLSPIA
jgi:hypothetical protein